MYRFNRRKELKMTDIEKREESLLDMMGDFSTWKGVTKINTNDENIYSYRYNDTVVALEKIDAFNYRVLVYDMTPKFSMFDLEAEYHFNIESGTMLMILDNYQEHRTHSVAVILTDLFGGIDKELWWWVNKPIHIDLTTPEPRPISEFFEKLKSGELFSDEEMEVNENEDKHN